MSLESSYDEVIAERDELREKLAHRWPYDDEEALEFGPFDPDELVQWAEMYGHPETWAIRAKDAHARAERLAAERGTP
jgi:hypothetical protein